MRASIRRELDLDLIRALEFSNPDREPHWKPVEDYVWWVARNPHGDILGYAAARMWATVSPRTGYLAWARVFPGARGKGLQRRLVRARVAWCRAQGALQVVTYTAPHNAPSMVNLIRSGFLPWDPVTPWFGTSWVYWRLPLARRAPRGILRGC